MKLCVIARLQLLKLSNTANSRCTVIPTTAVFHRMTFFYRWKINSRPTDVPLSDITSRLNVRHFAASKVTRQNASGKRQELRAVGCDQVTPTTGRLGAQTASAALPATTDNFSFPLGLLLPQAERTSHASLCFGEGKKILISQRVSNESQQSVSFFNIRNNNIEAG